VIIFLEGGLTGAQFNSMCAWVSAVSTGSLEKGVPPIFVKTILLPKASARS
jgi:hypothetical protein